MRSPIQVLAEADECLWRSHESELFLSYFPNGLIIKEGGIESGFRHVEPSE